MNYTTIAVETEGHIGRLYLNRPQVLNALCPEMRDELMDFLRRAAADDQLRVLILSGKGRAFSAGADLNMFKRNYETYRESGQDDTLDRAELPKAFIHFPKPIIAAINGPAVGFGITLPLNCDIRLASTQAKFSFAFARVGVTPEFGSSYFLPRLIGYGKAAELIYTAKMFDPDEALAIGLVNRVVPHDRLMAEAEALAKEIAAMAPSAIRAAKKLLRHGSHSTLEQSLDYEALIFQHATRTAEHYAAVGRIMEHLKKKQK